MSSQPGTHLSIVSRIVSDPTQLWTAATTSPLQHRQHRVCHHVEEDDSRELFSYVWRFVREAAILFKALLHHSSDNWLGTQSILLLGYLHAGLGIIGLKE